MTTFAQIIRNLAVLLIVLVFVLFFTSRVIAVPTVQTPSHSSDVTYVVSNVVETDTLISVQ